MRPLPLLPGSRSPAAGLVLSISSDPADCHTDTPASAIFTQEGSTIDGSLSAYSACGLDGVRFHGTLDGDHLEGDVVKDTFRGQATGTLSGDQLELVTSDLWSDNRQTPAGVMHLHRR